MQKRESPAGVPGFKNELVDEKDSTQNPVPTQGFTLEQARSMLRERSAQIPDGPDNESRGNTSGNGIPQAPGTATSEPQDASTGLFPVCPVPPVFPSAVQKLLDESVDAFSVPPAVPVATFLALLSCLVGRTRAIEAKPGWVEHGNIWVVLVAPSGLGKTPVAHAFFRPIAEREYCKYQEWKEDCGRFEVDMLDFNRTKKEERGMTPKKPKRTQYYLDDATLEALGDALQDNPRGVMWRVDELSGLLSSFDKYSSGGKEGGTRARLLSAYDNQEWKSGRRDTARNIHIPAACVSIFGGLQPAMLSRSFDGSDADVGFLPRFMFVCAEREKPALWSETSLSAGSAVLLRQVVDRLAEFELTTLESGELVPAVFRLSGEAKTCFVNWYNQQALESWEQLTEGMADALGQKLKGHALRLCLLLHCLDIALGETDGLRDVPGDTMQRALELAEWVKANQLKALALFSGSEGKQHSPVEKAVMEAVLAESECGGDSLTIPNARLVELVNERLPVAVKPEQVGRAATKLGLAVTYIGKERGRKATPEKVEAFRTTVGTVGTVGTPCASTVSSVRQYENEPSGLSVEPALFTQSPTVTDSSKNYCRNPENLEYQDQPTVPTVPTVA